MSFEYSFPAVRGIQARHECYISMCPIRLLKHLFKFDDDRPATHRAQRSLNTSRIPKIARYVLDNPEDYCFAAAVVGIGGACRFEPFLSTADAQGRDDLGLLYVSMDAQFSIDDGQHRIMALIEAVQQKSRHSTLDLEHLPVVFFMDAGLLRAQKRFRDLNWNAVRVSKSLNLLYDHRDPATVITRRTIKGVRLLRELTELEHNTPRRRSRKLFTLAAIHTATIDLVEGIEGGAEAQVQLAVDYWEALGNLFTEWQQVLSGQLIAQEVRESYLHTQAITLEALGQIGNWLLITEPEDWKLKLQRLSEIDWSRSNPVWEGLILHQGRITKSDASIKALGQFLSRHIERVQV